MKDHIAVDAASSLAVDQYRHHIAHLGLPYERETEMILVMKALWGGFVDRAFGHDPIQLVAGDRLQLWSEGPAPVMLALEPIPHHNHHDLASAFEIANEEGQRRP